MHSVPAVFPRCGCCRAESCDVAALCASLFDLGKAVRKTPFQDWTLCMRHPVAGHRGTLVRAKVSGSGCGESASKGAYDMWEVIGIERNQLAALRTCLRNEVCTACPCSDNVREFFETLGHVCDREFVRRGVLIETKSGVEVRVMQCFANGKAARDTPEVTLASAKKTTTTPLVPWLLEISGKGNTPEARKLVESNIIGLLGDLKEMVSVVAAKRGELGQPIKYRVLE